MNRRDLLAHLRAHGCVNFRHGAKHDIWRNPANGYQSPGTRHRVINKITAKAICRQLDVPAAV